MLIHEPGRVALVPVYEQETSSLGPTMKVRKPQNAEQFWSGAEPGTLPWTIKTRGRYRGTRSTKTCPGDDVHDYLYNTSTAVYQRSRGAGDGSPRWVTGSLWKPEEQATSTTENLVVSRSFTPHTTQADNLFSDSQFTACRLHQQHQCLTGRPSDDGFHLCLLHSSIHLTLVVQL